MSDEFIDLFWEERKRWSTDEPVGVLPVYKRFGGWPTRVEPTPEPTPVTPSEIPVPKRDPSNQTPSLEG